MSRIVRHPILGKIPERKVVNFTYNENVLEGYEGEPIAVALRVAGVMVHRYTKKTHEPRGGLLRDWKMYRLCYGSGW